jgi:hypothetical protein
MNMVKIVGWRSISRHGLFSGITQAVPWKEEIMKIT